MLTAIAAATLLCLAPLAESGAKTANDLSYEYYEDALRLFGLKDYRAALIQLKNALQQDHRNLSARVLLGKTYLRLGDGTAAERQLTGPFHRCGRQAGSGALRPVAAIAGKAQEAAGRNSPGEPDPGNSTLSFGKNCYNCLMQTFVL